MSTISVRWHAWLTEYRRKEALDARPARFTKSSAKGLAFFGRWLAGASGIGVALSISAMFSSYTSLTTVADDHLCIASQFVSHTVEEGRVAALQFVVAGVLALVAAAFPRAAWVSRNLKLHDLLDEKIQPVRFRMWASEFSEKQLFIRSGFWQLFPLIRACILFQMGIDHAFGL